MRVTLLAALLLAPAFCPAQHAQPVAAGARVRAIVDRPRGRFRREMLVDGALVRLDADSLVIRAARGDSLAVALPAVRELQVAQRRTAGEGARHGARLGAAIGGGIGVIGAVVLSTAKATGPDAKDYEHVAPILGGAFLVGSTASGGIVGSVLGLHFRGARWATVPLPR